MYILYTSSVNPKGVAAKNALDKLSVQYEQITIEYSDKSVSRERALSLLQVFLERADAPLTLPFLAQTTEVGEKLVLLGFEAKEWEAFFQLGAQHAPTAAAGIPATVPPFDPTHVPVVGAEQEVVQ